jgi:hypothetical protein
VSHTNPARFQNAKAAVVTAAVVATTAALTAGIATPAPDALLTETLTVVTEVELAALPDIIGIYGVGPVFWTAQALGLTPDGVIKAAVGLAGDPQLTATVSGLLDFLDAVLPVEAGFKGPQPSDVYNAVNGLDYSLTGVADWLTGSVKGSGFADFINGAAAELAKAMPILNQRRDIIFSESLGGVTTSLAHRDMINAVQSDDPNWGDGVTGQWLIFFDNPSRPGGGLFTLATPFTNPLGVNLSSPPRRRAATPTRPPTAARSPRSSIPRPWTSPGRTTRCRMRRRR